MIMLAVIFGDLLDAYPTLFVTMIEWKCVNGLINKRKSFSALDLPGRCEWERLSYTVREGVHSPVKVNDQLGDADKQVVNSYGVRRQVGRTLCVCEGSTCMTCAKGAQGPRIKVYANNCQTSAQHRLLALARG